MPVRVRSRVPTYFGTMMTKGLTRPATEYALAKKERARFQRKAGFSKPARRSSEALANFAVKQQTLSKLIQRSSEEDRSQVEEIVRSIENEEQAETIFMLLESSLYFDNLADTKRSLQLASKGLEQANEVQNQNLQRKAHNIVAWNLAKVCDFEQAFAHLEHAIQLTIAVGKPLYHFAVLCNAVPILQTAGLLQSAKELSLRLTRYEAGTEELDYLHLQNAINGLEISRYTNDDATGEKFIDIARGKLTTAGAVGLPWKTYVDTHDALFMLQNGGGKIASEMIELAIAGRPECTNSRIDVTLRCAQAQCALRLNDKLKIKECKYLLNDLLSRNRTFAIHREQILRTLVTLYSADRTSRGRKLGLKYLRELNSHLVNVKHGQFFDKIGRRLGLETVGTDLLTAPFYAVPKSVFALEGNTVAAEPETCRFPVGEYDQVQAQALKFVDGTFRRIEARLRTRAFDVAEDWAVAADFSAERTGHHCFQVGRLAGFIASKLGLSDNRAVLIEMACRLHDIGKIAWRGACGQSSGVPTQEDFALIRQHTLLGARLLDSIDEPLFRLAASVARCHHEWWNGFGLPNSLKGDEIPLEARICLVADTYVCLIHPSHDRGLWREDDAIKQVSAMGGIQLDPNLVAVFLEVVQESGLVSLGVEESVSWLGSGGRRLSNAKSSLLKTISAGLENLEEP